MLSISIRRSDLNFSGLNFIYKFSSNQYIGSKKGSGKLFRPRLVDASNKALVDSCTYVRIIHQTMNLKMKKFKVKINSFHAAAA